MDEKTLEHKIDELSIRFEREIEVERAIQFYVSLVRQDKLIGGHKDGKWYPDPVLTFFSKRFPDHFEYIMGRVNILGKLKILQPFRKIESYAPK